MFMMNEPTRGVQTIPRPAGPKTRRSAARPAAIVGSEGVAEAVKARPDSRTSQSTVWNEPVYRALLNVVSDWVFIIAADGVIVECHPPPEPEATSIAKNFIGRKMIELLPMQLAQQARYYLEKTLRTGQTQTFSSQFLLRGRECQFQVRVALCAPGQIIALVRDITERHLREKEILEISNREQLRLGQDLHDGLGQHLTGITFLTRALQTKLTDRGIPEAEEVAEIGKLVMQALAQTRNLARGLFPVELSSGMVEALRDLSTTAEKLFNITCRLEGDESSNIKNRTVAHHLFRVAQEAINNSVKHGRATQVVLNLRSDGDILTLTVRDNGIGLPNDTAQSKGLGLRIMSYRAQKIGGTLNIARADEGGTLLTCSFKAPPEEV
jgi:two-component system, LuxR family, sensor kinase FixL